MPHVIAVDVRVMSDFVLTTAREPVTPLEPKFMQTLRGGCMLPARKQRQRNNQITDNYVPARWLGFDLII